MTSDEALPEAGADDAAPTAGEESTPDEGASEEGSA